jgi:serine/threonine-protein kinase
MFQKVIALTPDNDRGYYNLGAMYLMQGQYDDAIAALNHSIELRPTLDAYSNLGAAYFYRHRFAEAASMFEKARGLDDKDYLNWGNLGDALYWSQGRRQESVAAYKTAIELAQDKLQTDPKDVTALAYVAEYSAMLALAPKNPDVMFRAALVYNQLGDQRQTLDWLKKALAANFSRSTVRDTPDFGHLQSDPTFKSLIAGK